MLRKLKPSRNAKRSKASKYCWSFVCFVFFVKNFANLNFLVHQNSDVLVKQTQDSHFSEIKKKLLR